MSYVDVFIGGTLLLASWTGYRRGMLAAVAKIISYVVGVAVAIYFYRSFSEWLDQHMDLVQQVAMIIYNLLPLPTTVMTTAMHSMEFTELMDVIMTLPLPNFYQEQMLTYIDNYQIMLAGSLISIGEAIAMILARTLVDVGSFAMLLIVVVLLMRWVLTIALWPLGKSFLAGPNRIAGGVLGLATGLLTCVLVLGLLVPVVVIGQMGELQLFRSVGEHVQTSLLLPYFLQIFAVFQGSAGGLVPFANGLLKQG